MRMLFDIFINRIILEKSYYEVISNKIWGDKSNYDLCLDCKLGNETIKDIICNYVKSLNK